MPGAATCSADVLAGFAPPVPPTALARAETFAEVLAAGGEAVVPRRAASVVLLRDGDAGPEVHLLHRHARMPFAASVAAFPGGGVDPVDLGEPDPVAACAVRETTEETTVVLTPADLVPWARWVTPAYEPRRYDTTFFLAALPAGQEARDVSGEAERTEWVRPADALRARESGALALMPPTWSLLLELADLTDVAEALARGRGRTVVTVLPRLVETDGRWAFAYEVLP